jgi:orotate phosphoribosyltransferase
LRALLAASGALRQGHFRLSSGLHSGAYVQCALLLEDPARARRVGAALGAALGPLRPECVLAPALGGVVVGHEAATALGVPFRFTERQGEAMALRRGFALRPRERVAVVEDVVTTGKSSREVEAVAASFGAQVVGFGAILDRSAGRHGLGAALQALLSLDLPTYAPESCPLCADGVPIGKPGTRPG